jgi:hypothetical protein
MTVEKLNELIPTLYLSSELMVINWDSVSDTDKVVLINKAEDYVKNLRFQNGVEEMEGFDADLDKAKCCIVYDFLNSSMNSRLGAIRAGLKSYSGPDVSETYVDMKDLKNIQIVSEDYKKYLWKYIFRGAIQ